MTFLESLFLEEKEIFDEVFERAYYRHRAAGETEDDGAWKAWQEAKSKIEEMRGDVQPMRYDDC